MDTDHTDIKIDKTDFLLSKKLFRYIYPISGFYTTLSNSSDYKRFTNVFFDEFRVRKFIRYRSIYGKYHRNEKKNEGVESAGSKRKCNVQDGLRSI